MSHYLHPLPEKKLLIKLSPIYKDKPSPIHQASTCWTCQEESHRVCTPPNSCLGRTLSTPLNKCHQCLQETSHIDYETMLSRCIPLQFWHYLHRTCIPYLQVKSFIDLFPMFKEKSFSHVRRFNLKNLPKRSSPERVVLLQDA